MSLYRCIFILFIYLFIYFFFTRNDRPTLDTCFKQILRNERHCFLFTVSFKRFVSRSSIRSRNLYPASYRDYAGLIVLFRPTIITTTTVHYHHECHHTIGHASLLEKRLQQGECIRGWQTSHSDRGEKSSNREWKNVSFTFETTLFPVGYIAKIIRSSNQN